MKKLIIEQFVIDSIKSGSSTIEICENCLITPLAMDRIKSSGLKIIRKNISEYIPGDTIINKNKIAIGGDHTGFEIKEILKKYLSDKNFIIEDLGTNSKESCDYPDYAIAVAKKVGMKEVCFGILIDATGIPSAITANKFPGIRAATCYNEFSTKSSREHNNANIIVLGAKTLGEETIKSIIDTWIKTDFAGGRHQRRLDKIVDVEKLFMKF